MTLLRQVEEAHDRHWAVKQLVHLEAKNELALAESLYNLKKNNLYKKAVGEGIDTWVDYLKQPEVNITQHRAGKLVKMYEHMCVYLGYPLLQLVDIPSYALNYITEQKLMSTELVNLLLDHAKVLSEKDFKEQYHDEVSKEERTYTFIIMKKCDQTKTMEKVHGISSDIIKQTFNL